MQRPSAQESHIDTLLSNVSIKYTNGELVYDQIFPKVPVKKQSDLIPIFGKENFKRVSSRRADGDRSKSVYHTFSTDTYFCNAEALHGKVTDNEKENADQPIDPEMDCTEDVTERLLLEKECRVRDAILNGVTATSSPSVKWDAASGSTPDVDILNTAVATIHAAVFKVANTVIIPFNVAIVLTTNSTIKEIVKYTQNIMLLDGAILLPKVLWGLKVLIPGAGENTANLGQAETLSYVWGNNVIVAYVNPNPGIKRISLGYVFEYKPRTVKKWYEQAESSTYIEVEEKVTEKIIAKGCGYVLTDVLT